MRRLVCIVEGHGEVEALPNLCSRILKYLRIADWYVDPQPVRQPRGRLVDQSKPSPRRPSNRDGLRRAIHLARARPADGVLVVCDSDDDCAAYWGADVADSLGEEAAAGVMAVREYEAWLLTRFPISELKKKRIGAPDRIRNAKGAMRKLVPGYKPSTHQLAQTRLIDIDAARRQRSFEKLVSTLEEICRPVDRY